MFEDRFDHIDDMVFIVKDRDDEGEILGWLEDTVKKQDYHIDWVDGYYAPPVGSVLQIQFDLMRDVIFFKMVWG